MINENSKPLVPVEKINALLKSLPDVISVEDVFQEVCAIFGTEKIKSCDGKMLIWAGFVFGNRFALENVICNPEESEEQPERNNQDAEKGD